jgi:hypothetical protein
MLKIELNSNWGKATFFNALKTLLPTHPQVDQTQFTKESPNLTSVFQGNKKKDSEEKLLYEIALSETVLAHKIQKKTQHMFDNLGKSLEVKSENRLSALSFMVCAHYLTNFTSQIIFTKNLSKIQKEVDETVAAYAPPERGIKHSVLSILFVCALTNPMFMLRSFWLHFSSPPPGRRDTFEKQLRII